MLVNLLKVLGLLGLLGVGLALMLPPVTRGREAARRTQCKNNLKQIMLAVYNYEQEYHAFPPACTFDADGRPLHSWRTLLLPFLDQRQLYETIDLTKPWDDPANATAFNSVVTVYRCPSNPFPDSNSKASYCFTTYLAVVTPDSCLQSDQSRRAKEITDGAANTMMVIEVAHKQAVHWMQPIDADEQTVLKLRSTSDRPHPGGAYAALADGSVRFLSANIAENTLHALITIDAGDTVGDF